MEHIYDTPDWPHDLTEAQQAEEGRAIDREINAVSRRLAKKIQARTMQLIESATREDWWNA